MAQFPSPDGTPARHPVRHSYADADPSPLGRFNGRDAASVAANTVAAQPAIIVASTLAANLDSLAGSVGGAMLSGAPSMTASFVTTWLVATAVQAIFKAIAAVLRNYGESMFRDFIAWLWKWAIIAAWDAFKSQFFFWRRPRRESRRRPWPVFPEPNPRPGTRRRPVRDAIRRVRNR